MPLIQIDLERELYDTHHEQLSAAVHQAQIDALGIPEDDLFQVFTPHDAGELKFSPTYNDVDRRSLLLVRVTMVHMYPVATKRAFFKAVVEHFAALGVRPEDIQIAVVENGFEDWYAGKL